MNPFTVSASESSFSGMENPVISSLAAANESSPTPSPPATQTSFNSGSSGWRATKNTDGATVYVGPRFDELSEFQRTLTRADGTPFADSAELKQAMRNVASDFYNVRQRDMEEDEQWSNKQMRDWFNWDGYSLHEHWNYPDEYDIDPEQVTPERLEAVSKYAKWPRGKTSPSRRFGHTLTSQTDKEYMRGRFSIRDWDGVLHRQNVREEKRRNAKSDYFKDWALSEKNDYPSEDKHELSMGFMVSRSHALMAFPAQTVKWSSRFFKDGTTYEGLRRNTRLNGLGNLKFGLLPQQRVGKSVIYPAGFQNAKTGDTYVGEFRNNRAWGLGTYSSIEEAEVFEGEFYQGRRHGCGRVTKYKPFLDMLKETGDPVAAKRYWDELLADPETRPLVREMGTWQWDQKISDVRDPTNLIVERGWCDEPEVDGTVQETKNVTMAARMFANKPKGQVIRYTASDQLTEVPVDPEQDPVVYTPGTEWMMPGPLGQLSRVPDNPYIHNRLKQAHALWTHVWRKWNVVPDAEDIREADQRVETAQNISENYVQDNFQLSRKGFPDYEKSKQDRWRRIKNAGKLDKYWPYMPNGELYDPDGDVGDVAPNSLHPDPYKLIPPAYDGKVPGVVSNNMRGVKSKVLDDYVAGKPTKDQYNLKDFVMKGHPMEGEYREEVDRIAKIAGIEDLPEDDEEEAPPPSDSPPTPPADAPKKKKVVKRVVKKVVKKAEPAAEAASLSLSLSRAQVWLAPRARLVAASVRGRAAPVAQAVARPARAARAVAEQWMHSAARSVGK
ncbi:hypothetical protein NFJ02_27g63060 [Pycnococcus provasolii]